MTVSDTIRYALNIGSALQRIHADGRCHGALTPELIQVSESGARLLPATPGALKDLTPYTAPEIIQGEPADARTDIFAFGAVLYDMASGRHAFLANSPEKLKKEIMAKGFSPIGHEGLDQVVKRCLAKDPAARWQRVQQVQMELKLLAIAARQNDPGVLLRRQERGTAVRAELQRQANSQSELERAVTARANELAQSFTTALDDIKLHFAEVEKCLDASQQRADHFEHSTVQAAESTRREIAALQLDFAGEVHTIQQAAMGQAHAIEWIKASLARNEDYIERVVEALEALQNLVLDQPDEPETAAVAMESRIVRGENGFAQAYNAQAAVEADFQLIVGQAANDRQQVGPMVQVIEEQSEQRPEEILADNADRSEKNLAHLEPAAEPDQRIDAFVAADRQKHGEQQAPGPRGPLPKGATPADRTRRKLQSKAEKAVDAARKGIVEPVFGQIKQVRGFRQSLLGGLQKVRGEWASVSLTHNISKLRRLASVSPDPPSSAAPDGSTLPPS